MPWKFDFPEIGVAALAGLAYLFLHGLLWPILILALGFALIAMFRS